MYKTFIYQHIINNAFIRKILFSDIKKKRRTIYIERFREHKQSKFSRNIVVQMLPLLGVLVFLYVLNSQNLFFGTVLSGSMEPTFKKGDLVLMQSFYGKPEVGDIIMFIPKDGMEPVTHRIISIDNYGYIMTKGDANKERDDWIINKNNINAKSVTIGGSSAVIPGLGFALVPRVENFTITKKLTAEKGMEGLFQQFRAMTPLLIIFMLMIYIFTLFDDRSDEKQRFGRNGKRKR